MAAPRVHDTARASWSGTLRVGLVAFPVQAFNIASSDTEVHLHQLHAACDRRIQYHKVCPVHGEVDKDEIVSAYEYSRGKYVRIEPEEMDRLRTDADRALKIDSFVEPQSVDMLCLSGQHYYLAPQKDDAQEPYGVIYRAMEEKNRWGIGTVLFLQQEHLVLVRPYHNVLLMSMLRHCDELRAAEPFEVSIPKAADKNVKLAEQLIEGASEDNFDFAAHKDPFKQRLQQLIESKIEGREIAMPPAEKEPEVINLADALKKSIARSQGGRAETNGHHNGHEAPSGRHSPRRNGRSSGRGHKRASEASAGDL